MTLRKAISRNKMQPSQKSPKDRTKRCSELPSLKGAPFASGSLRGSMSARPRLAHCAPGVPYQAAPSETPIPATGLNLGGARPGFPPCRDPPPSPPGPRRRRRPRVRPQSRSPKVAPVPSRPLPPLTMIPGPRLLLATVLCLGLGALVSSSGSSGVRKRGPSVTAKVIFRLLQLPLLRARHRGA